jgi:hypothetical protein
MWATFQSAQAAGCRATVRPDIMVSVQGTADLFNRRSSSWSVLNLRSIREVGYVTFIHNIHVKGLTVDTSQKLLNLCDECRGFIKSV